MMNYIGLNGNSGLSSSLEYHLQESIQLEMQCLSAVCCGFEAAAVTVSPEWRRWCCELGRDALPNTCAVIGRWKPGGPERLGVMSSLG